MHFKVSLVGKSHCDQSLSPQFPPGNIISRERCYGTKILSSMEITLVFGISQICITCPLPSSPISNSG